MSEIVSSIPWNPEKAWTTARAKCAISGITRCGFTPQHVQIFPPCEGCLPPTIQCQAVAGLMSGDPAAFVLTVKDALSVDWSSAWYTLEVLTQDETGVVASDMGNKSDEVSVTLQCAHFDISPTWTFRITAYGENPITNPGTECLSVCTGELTLDDDGLCTVVCTIPVIACNVTFVPVVFEFGPGPGGLPGQWFSVEDALSFDDGNAVWYQMWIEDEADQPVAFVEGADPALVRYVFDCLHYQSSEYWKFKVRAYGELPSANPGTTCWTECGPEWIQLDDQFFCGN